MYYDDDANASTTNSEYITVERIPPGEMFDTILRSILWFWPSVFAVRKSNPKPENYRKNTGFFSKIQ